MKRRDFLKTSSLFALGCMTGSCGSNNKKKIQLGCLNRPWYSMSLERAIDGIKSAGFENIGLFPHGQELKLTFDTGVKDYQSAQKLLLERNLKLIMTSPRMDLSKPPKKITEDHIPIMKTLQEIGCPFILIMGTNKKELYSKYIEIIKYYADAAQQYNIQIVMKPHGGMSSSGALCAETVQKVGSENFRICYDPANIFYYDGYDPVKELKNVVEYVTALIAKDYRPRESKKPDVLITPGDGEINFEEIFSILKNSGFSGPCLIECVSGSTPDEIDREANRAFNYISGFLW